MIDEEATQPEKDSRSADRIRKPWFAPTLAVYSVSDVTRTGSTSCRNDGSSVYAPTS